MFWIMENELEVEPLSNDIQFVLIQFIEIGGDHLDLLMEYQQGRVTGKVTLQFNFLRLENLSFVMKSSLLDSIVKRT